jgi:molecular chaperone DnaJ
MEVAMTVDYYLILGVPRDAETQQVKQAYRSLSKRHHPDLAGPGGHDRFLQIQRAYETLCDPQRRREYDRQLQDRPSAAAPPEPWRVNPFTSFQTYRPSFEDVFDRFMQNFTHRHMPISQRTEQMNVELLLTPAEAAAGRKVELELPLSRVCSRCDGTGRTGFFRCDGCDGSGMHWEQTVLDVRLPAGVRDGTEVPLSLRHLGVNNMYLNLHVRVAAGEGFSARA